MTLNKEEIQLLLDDGWEIANESPLEFVLYAQFAGGIHKLYTEDAQREMIEQIKNSKEFDRIMKESLKKYKPTINNPLRTHLFSLEDDVELTTFVNSVELPNSEKLVVEFMDEEDGRILKKLNTKRDIKISTLSNTGEKVHNFHCKLKNPKCYPKKLSHAESVVAVFVIEYEVADIIVTL